MASSLDKFISDLIGTTRSYFKLGISGVRLKNSGGNLDVRNTGDTAWAQTAASQVKLQGSNASNGVILTAPGSLAANYTLTFPVDDGTTNQVLATDGSGGLSWQSVSIATNELLVQTEEFTEATSSPLTIFTPPANARIERVVVQVDTAAGAGSPTISVGVSGTAERDMAAAENDLKTVAVYEVAPMSDVTGTPAAVIATITPAGQTFAGRVRVYYTLAA